MDHIVNLLTAMVRNAPEADRTALANAINEYSTKYSNTWRGLMQIPFARRLFGAVLAATCGNDQ